MTIQNSVEGIGDHLSYYRRFRRSYSVFPSENTQTFRGSYFQHVFQCFLAPNLVYSIHSGNDYLNESLALPDAYVRIFTMMVSHLWTGLITVLAYIVRAVSRRLASNVSAFP